MLRDTTLIVQANSKKWLRVLYWLQNSFKRILWGLIFATAVLAAFRWRFSKYVKGSDADLAKTRLMSWSLPVAKGCGQAMKVIFSAILFPVSRNTLTWLRATWLKHVFPFDEMIAFHMIIGVAGFVLAWTHGLLHVIDFKNATDPKREHLWREAFPHYDQPSAAQIWMTQEAITGIGMLLIFTIAFPFASPWPRKARFLSGTWIGKVLNDFNLFWYTHHLFALFYLFMFFHPWPALPDEKNEWGKSDTWAWAGIPVMIYIGERVVRYYRHKTQNTALLDVKLLEGGVVGLKLSKPRSFDYKPGMYVFVNIPQISMFEWHPFSLTSSPHDDFISVHIRSAGDWTTSLYDIIFEGLQKNLHVFPNSTFTSTSKLCASVTNTTESVLRVSTPLNRVRSYFFDPPPIVISEDGQKVVDGIDDAKDRKRIKRKKATHVHFVLPRPRAADLFSTATRVHDDIRENEPSAENQGVGMSTLFTETGTSVASSTRGTSSVLWAETTEDPIMRDQAAVDSINMSYYAGTLVDRSGRLQDQLQQSHILTKFEPDESGKKYPVTPVRGAFTTRRTDWGDFNSGKGSPPAMPHTLSILPQVLVDGPYGAPAQDFDTFPAVLLIGAGVGVTPFISVMRDMLNKFHNSKCPQCQMIFNIQGLQVQRIYFHWLVRESGQAAWFEDLLDDLVKDDPRCILDLNIHITREKPPAQEPTSPDVEFGTGLCTGVLKHYGRPSWEEIFAYLRRNHRKSTIGVFYCGPPALEKELRKQCRRKSSLSTKFRFHAEVFG